MSNTIPYGYVWLGRRHYCHVPVSHQMVREGCISSSPFAL